jgi:DNA-binding response OmpR family regulator
MRLRKVMIVEDEALLAQHEAEVVRDMTRAETVIACTLAEARKQADAGDVDLALLDIALPDGQVFEVAETLRQHATPYIFVTAYGLTAIPLQHRAAPLLGKPFRESDLRAALSTLIVPRPGGRGTGARASGRFTNAP